MWLFGNASKEEIETIKKQGWTVEEVDKTYFNKALNPKCNPEEEADINEHNGDKLVAVFIDYDISKQLAIFHNKNNAVGKLNQERNLEQSRRLQVQHLYETELEMPEDQPILETEGIYINDSHYIQNFYYENIIAGEPCIHGTFHVYFEEESDKVIEYRPGDGVPVE